jgi:hypothetical protein
MNRCQHRGRPLGKKRKTKDKNTDTCVQGPHSPNPDPTILANDLPEMESDSDFGKDDWDPHAGTKPSPLDGEASDEHWDPKDDMEDAESEAINLHMVQMLLDLQDNDLRDHEWKPMHKQKKMRTKAG